MGSDPQYVKYPKLSLAQNIFLLSNSATSKSVQEQNLKTLQDAITEDKMAPLYWHLAHPTEGILNTVGEGTSQRPGSKRPGGISSIVGKKPTPKVHFPWDEKLYESLKSENSKELEEFEKEEQEATEKAGETEIQAAKGKRAEFWARVGDKVCEFSLSDRNQDSST